MKIILTPDVAVKLLAYDKFTSGEFSGFGFVRITEDKNFEVYDFVLQDIGSSTYTEIAPEKLAALGSRPDGKNLKCWLHKHPVGNGEPGPHNWSGTDHNTCVKEPFGMTPELIGWSLAVVITPGGWVGRYDDHVKHKTVHLEVDPPVHQFLADINSVEEVDLDEAVEEIAAIAEEIGEAVNGFSAETLIALGVTQEQLWDQISAKLNWHGLPPLTYAEWVAGVDPLDERPMDDYRGYVWPEYDKPDGRTAVFHRMTDREFMEEEANRG